MVPPPVRHVGGHPELLGARKGEGKQAGLGSTEQGGTWPGWMGVWASPAATRSRVRAIHSSHSSRLWTWPPLHLCALELSRTPGGGPEEKGLIFRCEIVEKSQNWTEVPREQLTRGSAGQVSGWRVVVVVHLPWVLWHLCLASPLAHAWCPVGGRA